MEFTRKEKDIIESALNAYWNDAHLKLENGEDSYRGTKRPLGDLEKIMYKERLVLVKPILERLENDY